MKKSRTIAALLLSVVFLAPLGFAHAGELVFKRISCRDATTLAPFSLFTNFEPDTSVTIQVTRDTCRPTYRNNPGTFIWYRKVAGGGGSNAGGMSRNRKAPYNAFRTSVRQGETLFVFFDPNGATRVSGTFDVKVFLE